VINKFCPPPEGGQIVPKPNAANPVGGDTNTPRFLSSLLTRSWLFEREVHLRVPHRRIRTVSHIRFLTAAFLERCLFVAVIVPLVRLGFAGFVSKSVSGFRLRRAHCHGGLPVSPSLMMPGLNPRCVLQLRNIEFVTRGYTALLSSGGFLSSSSLPAISFSISKRMFSFHSF